jgi:hypothetical protein
LEVDVGQREGQLERVWVEHIIVGQRKANRLTTLALVTYLQRSRDNLPLYRSWVPRLPGEC